MLDGNAGPAPVVDSPRRGPVTGRSRDRSNWDPRVRDVREKHSLRPRRPGYRQRFIRRAREVGPAQCVATAGISIGSVVRIWSYVSLHFERIERFIR